MRSENAGMSNEKPFKIKVA